VRVGVDERGDLTYEVAPAARDAGYTLGSHAGASAAAAVPAT
jgi:hypothetical protein